MGDAGARAPPTAPGGGGEAPRRSARPPLPPPGRGARPRGDPAARPRGAPGAAERPPLPTAPPDLGPPRRPPPPSERRVERPAFKPRSSGLGAGRGDWQRGVRGRGRVPRAGWRAVPLPGVPQGRRSSGAAPRPSAFAPSAGRARVRCAWCEHGTLTSGCLLILPLIPRH